MRTKIECRWEEEVIRYWGWGVDFSSCCIGRRSDHSSQIYPVLSSVSSAVSCRGSWGDRDKKNICKSSITLTLHWDFIVSNIWIIFSRKIIDSFQNIYIKRLSSLTTVVPWSCLWMYCFGLLMYFSTWFSLRHSIDTFKSVRAVANFQS